MSEDCFKTVQESNPGSVELVVGLVVNVSGVERIGADHIVRCEQVAVLYRHLDDAVLEFLSLQPFEVEDEKVIEHRVERRADNGGVLLLSKALH